jgi:hypothetical protein
MKIRLTEDKIRKIVAEAIRETLTQGESVNGKDSRSIYDLVPSGEHAQYWRDAKDFWKREFDFDPEKARRKAENCVRKFENSEFTALWSSNFRKEYCYLRAYASVAKEFLENASKKLMNEDAWEDAWADDKAEIEEVFRKNGWEIEKLLEKNGASYYFMSRSSEHNGTTPKQIVRQLNVALGGNGKAEHFTHPMRDDLEIFRIA